MRSMTGAMLNALHKMVTSSAMYTNRYLFAAPSGFDMNEINWAKRRNQRNKNQKRKAKR
jgi:hypothetical protein